LRASTSRQAPAESSLISVEIADSMMPADLDDLCDAADTAIEAGGGFGWIELPARDRMERYWRGVLAVPERHLLLARMDGVVCGAVQLIEPSRHNEAQSFSATVLAAFVAPWARGHGAGRRLIDTAETLALGIGYKVLQADMRETQDAARHLFESAGYRQWGINPAYALVQGRMISGLYYAKTIAPFFVPKNVRAA
jgi:ribosomal protein S18 acetylase RimI-like enzyme